MSNESSDRSIEGWHMSQFTVHPTQSSRLIRREEQEEEEGRARKEKERSYSPGAVYTHYTHNIHLHHNFLFVFVFLSCMCQHIFTSNLILKSEGR